MILGYVDDGYSYFTPFPALNPKERVIRGAGVDMATTNQSNILWDPSERIQVP